MLDRFCSRKCWKVYRISNTIENWLDYIVLDKRLSNGFTEKLNNKIKSGFGYKNF